MSRREARLAIDDEDFNPRKLIEKPHPVRRIPGVRRVEWDSYLGRWVHYPAGRRPVTTR